MADPIKDTQTDPLDNICDLVDNHAQVMRTLMQTVSWGQGVLTVTKGNSGPEYIDVPYVPDYIISGCVATIGTNPNALTVSCTTGSFQINAVLYARGGTGTVTLSNGDATNPRIDIICLDVTGVLQVTAGTAAASPSVPATPANRIKIAEVFVPALATATSTGTAAASLTRVQYLFQPVSNGFVQGGQLFWSTTAQRYLASTGLRIGSGANLGMGSAVLVAGTVAVANSLCTANSRIWLTRRVTGGTLGHLSYTPAAGTFTINSSSALETSTIDWLIVNPA